MRMKFQASVILSLCSLSAWQLQDTHWGIQAFVPLHRHYHHHLNKAVAPTIATRRAESATDTSATATTVNGDADDDETVATEAETIAPPVLETKASFSVDTTTSEFGNPVHTLTFESIPGQEVGVPSITMETGKIGRQAAGAIVLTRGDTVLYATAARDHAPKDNIDFLPLSVEHQERFSSAGLTSGSYNKRDGRPAEHEILTCRLIDRPLRPLINSGWRHETQLLNWVLSYDG
ncbi:Polyribonucleotide nucleotidyltransferase (Partial), partial [Seminavis robusta]|eukprot:Sro968_g226120.1 Polyribonucleotide nucleotidyltransferase (233) ;mRNA; f:40477-41176